METTAVTRAIATATGFAAMVERASVQQSGLCWNDGSVESMLRERFARMSERNNLWQRETFARLLLHSYSEGCYTVLRNPSFLDVLANISAFGNKMMREPETWTKTSFVAEDQLASLVRHCFAKYEVPAFMENVFAGGSRIHMLWYVQLGRGDSVQQLCGFPVQFTNRMAHEFRHTPDSYSVAQAIRRAQALGYGATKETADALAWSVWSQNFDAEEFRATAIQFIAQTAEPVAFDVLWQVLVYLDAMHRAQPGYSMRGRTWAALTRQAAEWHRDRALKAAAEGYMEWDNGMLRDFSIEKELAIFRIVQLTNSEGLYEEGEAMGHCVAEYAYDCMEGDSAIFSLRKYAGGTEGFERLATIEVAPQSRTVVQAKAHANMPVCKISVAVIREWAVAEGLAVDYEDEYGAHDAEAFAALHERRQEREDSNILLFVKVGLFVLYFLVRACNHSI